MSNANAPTPTAHTPPFVPHCPYCHYDLSTLPDGPCPECGAQFEYAILRDRWLTEQAPNSDEALLRGFVPLCPTCKYDLCASPEGPCPECGAIFTFGGLRARWIADRRVRHIPIGVLFGIGAVLCHMLWIASINDRRPEPLMLAIASALLSAVSFAWARACRDALLVRRPALLLLVLPIALLSAGVCYPHIFWAGPIVPLPWCIGVFIAWLSVSKRHPVVPGLLLAICALTPGILVSWSGANGVWSNHHWSDVDDWYLPGTRRALPPTMAQELWVGVAYLTLGLAVLGFATLFLKRRAAVQRAPVPDASPLTPSPSPPPSSSPYPPG